MIYIWSKKTERNEQLSGKSSEKWWLLEEPGLKDKSSVTVRHLTAESVESASLAFQGIDNVHGGNGLPLGVFSVGDSITDHVLQEHLENTAGLFVDKTGDTLHTTTASQTTDSGLGDTLDVVTKNLPVALGTSLSETLASFSAARHVSVEHLRRAAVRI